MFRISGLLHDDEYTGCSKHADIAVTAIVSNTAKIRKGCVFVCICGTKHDSHADVGEAIEKGASVIVAQRPLGDDISVPVLIVPDTRRALALMWSRSCGDPQDNLRMIAVTGTNGKTSTTFMIRSALQAASFRVGLIGTTGCYLDGVPFHPLCEAEGDSRLTTMTTPDPDLLYPTLKEMADAGVTHVIMEVSSHALEQMRVAPITFDMALFTNLSSEHMDLHKNMEKYMLAKAKLFKQTKVGIFNADDPYAERMASYCHGKCLFCSTSENTDYTASDIRSLGIRGSEYTFNAKETKCLLRLQIPGRFSVSNSLLACAAACEMGVCAKDLRRGVENLRGVPGRMERITDDDSDITVMIDYAHTEAALRQILRTVRSFLDKNERLVLVFGCGGDRDKTKRAAMGRCAEEEADFVVITSDNPRSENPLSIIRQIISGFTDAKKRKVIVNRRNAIAWTIENAKKHDVILLVGKGHEHYEIIGEQTIPFYEADIVREEINRRKSRILSEDPYDGASE